MCDYTGFINWFSQAVLGYFLRSTTSLALNICLGFEYQAWFFSFWAGLISNWRSIGYHHGMYATVTCSTKWENKCNLPLNLMIILELLGDKL